MFDGFKNGAKLFVGNKKLVDGGRRDNPMRSNKGGDQAVSSFKMLAIKCSNNELSKEL